MEEEGALKSSVPHTAKHRAREARRDALRGQSVRASDHLTLHRSAGSRAKAGTCPSPLAHFIPSCHHSRCQAPEGTGTTQEYLSLRVPALSSSPRLGERGQGRQGQLSL